MMPGAPANHPPADVATDPSPRRRLTLLDTTSIIVGIIIGAGFFETTPQVARGVGSLWATLVVWVAGGLIALAGAVCYAELTAAWPRDGGEYVYLTRAFGRRTGFVFAWAWFWVVRPGNLGAMAYVFARYADELLPLPLGRYAFGAYAVGAVVVLTAVNALGVQTGKWTQNLLTAAKVAGLLAVFATGLLLAAPPESLPPTQDAVAAAPTVAGLYLAMILVLFTYGGWNDMSYVADEVRDPDRNLLRGLVLGTVAVVAIYLVGNVVFARALGFQQFAASEAIAADVMRHGFGAAGGRFISALVCVSCLGALNGMILTSARVYYAVGTDYPDYAWLGKWNVTLNSPVRALAFQAAATLALVAMLGLGREGFERLVVFTAPLFWFFLLLTGLSLFVLRRREPHTPRPYRVAGYPWTPLLFCASSGFMVYASTRYAFANRAGEALWAVGLTATGVLASLYSVRRNDDESERT